MERCNSGIYPCKIISGFERFGSDNINFYLMKSLQGLGQPFVESKQDTITGAIQSNVVFRILKILGQLVIPNVATTNARCIMYNLHRISEDAFITPTCLVIQSWFSSLSSPSSSSLNMPTVCPISFFFSEYDSLLATFYKYWTRHNDPFS